DDASTDRKVATGVGAELRIDSLQCRDGLPTELFIPAREGGNLHRLSQRTSTDTRVPPLNRHRPGDEASGSERYVHDLADRAPPLTGSLLKEANGVSVAVVEVPES